MESFAQSLIDPVTLLNNKSKARDSQMGLKSPEYNEYSGNPCNRYGENNSSDKGILGDARISAFNTYEIEEDGMRVLEGE